MKKKLIVVTLALIRCLFGNVMMAQSIDPVSLVIAKVIKAIDLKVQKMQNETIWLQQAQKVAENALSKSKLAEIRDWEKEKETLYADYFKELATVKSAVTGLPQVKQIFTLQAQLKDEYKQFARNDQADKIMTVAYEVFSVLQQLTTDKQLSMKDAERIVLLMSLRDAMSSCLDSMRALNYDQARIYSNIIQRQKDLHSFKTLNSRP